MLWTIPAVMILTFPTYQLFLVVAYMLPEKQKSVQNTFTWDIHTLLQPWYGTVIYTTSRMPNTYAFTTCSCIYVRYEVLSLYYLTLQVFVMYLLWISGAARG